MADRNWRTNKAILQARVVAEELNQTAVVMLLINETAGTVELATYGTTGPRCVAAGKIGDFVFDSVMAALEAETLRV